MTGMWHFQGAQICYLFFLWFRISTNLPKKSSIKHIVNLLLIGKALTSYPLPYYAIIEMAEVHLPSMLNKFTRYKKRSDQTPLTFSVSLNEELCEDNSEYFIEGEGSILDQSQITSELDGSRGAHSRWNQTGNSSRLESETPRSFGWIKRPDLRLDVTCSTYDFFTPPLPPRSKAQKMQRTKRIW